jgi:hypothetical protein
MRSNINSRSPAHAIYIGGDAANVDLIVGKVYRVLKPLKLDGLESIRVIDESGEDYLYPSAWFVPIEVPGKVKRALAAAN